jgi:hypothetical protein
MKTPILSGPRRAGTLLVVLAAMFTGLGLLAVPALAQEKKDAPLAPPQPGKPDEPPVVWNYLAIAVVLGLAGGAALIPSKRGHQD